MKMGGHFVMTRLVQTEPFDDRKRTAFVVGAQAIDRSPTLLMFSVLPSYLSLRWPRRNTQLITRCFEVTQPRHTLDSHRWRYIVETPARHLSSTRIQSQISDVLFRMSVEPQNGGYLNIVAEGKRDLEMYDVRCRLDLRTHRREPASARKLTWRIPKVSLARGILVCIRRFVPASHNTHSISSDGLQSSIAACPAIGDHLLSVVP